MSTSADDLEKKKQAALAYALGWTRSALSGVLDNDSSREQVQRIFDATAMSHIAKSIGLTEEDFGGSDFLDRLSEVEKWRIQGYDSA